MPYEALKDIYAQEVAEKKHREHDKSQVLYEERGFCREGGEGDGYWNKKKVFTICDLYFDIAQLTTSFSHVFLDYIMDKYNSVLLIVINPAE